MPLNYSDDLLRRVLSETKTIACVGVSKNQIRPSYYVARYLGLKGFRVIPVNPAYSGETLLGEIVYPDLAELEAFGPGEVTERLRMSTDRPT